PARIRRANSALLDLDAYLLPLGFRGLRQGDGQDAVLEGGLDIVSVDAIGYAERALERAIIALGEIVVFLLLFLLVLPFAPDRQRAIRVFDLDVLLIDAGQFGRDVIALRGFGDIDGRNLAPADFATPERLDVEHRGPERRTPRPDREIFEQAVD